MLRILICQPARPAANQLSRLEETTPAALAISDTGIQAQQVRAECAISNRQCFEQQWHFFQCFLLIVLTLVFSLSPNYDLGETREQKHC